MKIEDYGFTIKKVGKQFVLYEVDPKTHELNKGLRVFPTIRTLCSKDSKNEIAFVTTANLGTIDETIASIVEKEAEKKAEKAKASIPEQMPPEQFSEIEIEKANKILEQGLAFKFFLDTAHILHAGDDNILLAEWISALSSHVTSTKINTWQIGSSGKGKSHCKYTVTKLLPYELYEVFTSASPLSLFYYVKKYGEESLDKTLLFIDEVEATKNALPMLRSLTSQTEIMPRHLSVHEAELLDIKIKGKRTVWFTSVKTFGSDQIKNRFINLNPDETKDQDINVFKLQDRLYREEKNIDEDKIGLCKALTRVIVDETKELKVKIPYGIEWAYKDRRFLYPFFLAFIRVVTKINFKHRKIEDGYIIANREDFETVKEIWRSSEKAISRRVEKSALTVLDCFEEDMDLAKTHAELAEETGKGTRQIENLCEELLNEGLVNRQKRARERGRPAWEYWKTKMQTIEDVCIINGEKIEQILNDVSHKTILRNSEMGENSVATGGEKRGFVNSLNTPLHFSPYTTGSLNPQMCEICHSTLAVWVGVDEDGENSAYGCSGCVRKYQESYRNGV